MKKILTISCFLLATVPVPITGAERLTGHTWRQAPPEIKIPLLRGFIEGYWLGRLHGYVAGMAEGWQWVEQKTCQTESWQACQEILRILRDDPLERERAKLLLGARTILKTDDVDYYSKEVDAFYDAFPLCRGDGLMRMLGLLVTSWAGTSKVSFQELCAKCGERGDK